MNELGTILAMGGYGAYVWPSYAIALTVLIANIVAARASVKRAQDDARRRLRTARNDR